MEFFFKPRGIAVIGASANPAKGGYFILNNLLKGFKGAIYPVNPGYAEIDELPCYPSVMQVPDPVDLAIIFVPAAFVPTVLRECAQRGIRGAMIESGKLYLYRAWWMLIFPGGILVALLFSINELGQRINHILNPRAQKND
jgi:acyl-CoA synthetase (NDP forming)